MTIAFIHSHQSFLPEINAYKDFFERAGADIKFSDLKSRNKINADVKWYFMGIDRMKKENNVITIHEYASASVPPFRNQKDFLKRVLNVKPDFRLFLNHYVKNELNFKDDAPFGLRDMGIDTLLFQSRQKTKDYDFIYTGSVAPERKIEKLLSAFTKNDLQYHSLLVLSKDYETIAARFSPYRNIHFKGPVSQEAVADHISKASFCINYMPDKEPFNEQTPVKFLEYLAAKIPVVSSRYRWIEKFQQHYGGDYFFLEDDLSNLTWNAVKSCKYSFPDMANWSWDNQIRKSGIVEFLQSKFNGLKF